MSIFDYPFLVLFGFVPSLLWLSYYLRKDCHPEPKRLIARVFIGVILLSPIAIGVELLFAKYFVVWWPALGDANSSSFYLWSAIVEEIIKLLAVWLLVIRNPEFDEPVDAMIYLVVAGLGFAAIENTINLFSHYGNSSAICKVVDDAICVLGVRSLGATLLHALSSALMGYFLGLAWFYHHHSGKLILFGLVIASLFHFTFNIIIVNFRSLTGVGITSLLLLTMAFLISFLFTAIKSRMQEHLST